VGWDPGRDRTTQTKLDTKSVKEIELTQTYFLDQFERADPFVFTTTNNLHPKVDDAKQQV
jgi:hypothetical protein